MAEMDMWNWKRHRSISCTTCAVPFVEEGIPLFIYPLKEMMRGGINGKVNRIFIRYDFFFKGKEISLSAMPFQ